MVRNDRCWTGGLVYFSEILRLTWKDVNLEKRTVTLRTRKRKGGQIQSDLVPMSETLYSCLKRRWNERDKSSPYVFTKPGGGIYTKNDKLVKEMMDKLCKKAGVKKFGFHAIRHHVAMILEDSGRRPWEKFKKCSGISALPRPTITSKVFPRPWNRLPVFWTTLKNLTLKLSKKPNPNLRI